MTDSYSEAPELTDGVGNTLEESYLDTYLSGNMRAIWVGTTAGDMDYYNAADTKARIPLGILDTAMVSSGSAPSMAFPTLPGCLLDLQGGIGNTETAMYSYNETYDPLGFSALSGSHYWITIPSGMDGTYKITISGQIHTPTFPRRFVIYVKISDVISYGHCAYTPQNTIEDGQFSFTNIINLVAGNTVRVYGSTRNGDSMDDLHFSDGTLCVKRISD